MFFDNIYWRLLITYGFAAADPELKMTWKRVSKKAGLHEKDKAPRLRFARQLLREEDKVRPFTMMSDEKIFALEESQRGCFAALSLAALSSMSR